MHEARAAQAAGPQEAGAIVYCEGAFDTLDGKTSHGLVRRSERYRILAVVDSSHAGGDAGEALDGRSRGIPIVSDLSSAFVAAAGEATHFVVGLAPLGGQLDDAARDAVGTALSRGLHVHSGLHDLLADNPLFATLAAENQVEIVDVRRPPAPSQLHHFEGKIAEVESTRVAVLGVDSGVGKRTTAWSLVDALRGGGSTAELIGTGQTSWLQGAEYFVPLDALVYDFVPGEVEHAVWRAWQDRRPEFLVLEGQGGLLNPGYFGGPELLVAARPHAVVLQHVPGRRDYDGCPGFEIESLDRQLVAVRGLTAAPVAAIGVSREGLGRQEVRTVCARITRETGLPAIDVLADRSGERLLAAVEASLR